MKSFVLSIVLLASVVQSSDIPLFPTNWHNKLTTEAPKPKPKAPLSLQNTTLKPFLGLGVGGARWTSLDMTGRGHKDLVGSSSSLVDDDKMSVKVDNHEDLNEFGDLFDKDGNPIGDWYCINKTLKQIVKAAISASPNNNAQMAEHIHQSVVVEFGGTWMVHAINDGYVYGPSPVMYSNDCCVFMSRRNMLVQALRTYQGYVLEDVI